MGDDGAPIDVIIVGKAAPRGEMVNIRLIGGLKMQDRGVQYDKLIAVLPKNAPLSQIKTKAELDQRYRGVSEVIGIWFANDKGPGAGMRAQSFAKADVARAICDAAIANFWPQTKSSLIKSKALLAASWGPASRLHPLSPAQGKGALKADRRLLISL